jgi:hypothetical protein
MRTKVLAWLAVVVVTATSCPGKTHRATAPRRIQVSVGKNVRVTGDRAAGTYARFDGTTDPVLRACSTSRFPQTEPTVAIDPHRPMVIVAGANEDCPFAAGRANWVGFYRSTDGGSSWSASLVPGYPGDDSRAGKRSPASRICAAASDPTVAFDLEGRLFFGFACIERKAFGGSTLLASYDQDGAHYVTTVVLARSRAGKKTNSPVEQDKINVAVDQTSGPGSGTVYAAWTQFAFQRRDQTVLVAHSTDHGATFTSPVVATRGQPGLFPDLAVGPTGTVYLTFRNIPEARDAQGEIGLTFSPNGGRTFTAVSTVTRFRPFDSTAFSGADRRECGDAPYRCRTGFTFPRFISFSAVAADASGVHVVWAARLPDGQSKIFVRNSPDGVRWTASPIVVDPVRQGHQFFPDAGSAGGAITVIFYDSRADAGYSPDRPPGNDPKGRSTGNFLDVYAAVSVDGGKTWSDHRLTSRRSNMNYEVDFGLVPFFGDYISVSAIPGTAFAVWTDTRDLRPGRESEVGGKDDHDGFDVAAWNCPKLDRACLTDGSLDQNIYGAALGEIVT